MTSTEDALLALASEVDAGFDRGVCAEIVAKIERYRDVDPTLGGVRVDDVRVFFASWMAELPGRE